MYSLSSPCLTLTCLCTCVRRVFRTPGALRQDVGVSLSISQQLPYFPGACVEQLSPTISRLCRNFFQCSLTSCWRLTPGDFRFSALCEEAPWIFGRSLWKRDAMCSLAVALPHCGTSAMEQQPWCSAQESLGDLNPPGPTLNTECQAREAMGPAFIAVG